MTFTLDEYQALLDRFGPVTAENVFLVAGCVQDQFGCVPRPVVTDLSSRTGLSEARLWGALTAYPGFCLEKEP